MPHRYLNYGLLGLASSLPADVFVYHGNFNHPVEFLKKHPTIAEADVVLLSLPSFHAVPWAKQFIDTLVLRNGLCEIHIGGRWVVDHNYEFIQRCFPKNVSIHKGLGERTVTRLSRDWYDMPLKPTMPLDYNLLVERESFHPSIEVSRGCGMGCHFCEEGEVPLTKLKSPIQIIDEAKIITESYSRSPNFYFESSMFAPKRTWCEHFLNTYVKSKASFLWRTESRVDILPSRKIEILAQAGLSILDLGLESASPKQIINMGKSNKPDVYLTKASTLLDTCKKYGIKTKVNMLLYPGETSKTLDETKAFFNQHHEAIFGISAYPAVVYGTDERLKYFDSLYQKQGAKGLRLTNVEGVWDVDLSSEIDAKTAKIISNEFAREFMPMKHYFELKKFSYFIPNYGWNMFSEDASKIQPHERPFGY